MDSRYYDMIFKRKSFHRFTGAGHLSQEERLAIEQQCSRLLPLAENIRTAFRIVPRAQTSCRRGEYCILIYSEPKEHYLQNVGYLAEQLDLWLASKNIGACWYGMGKVKETTYDGLGFVIMIAIEKAEETEFRKDYTKAKRKETEEIWHGSLPGSIASVVKYAPSACNTQPWLVECGSGHLQVYRVLGKRGIMPQQKISFYNRIDMGIFLLFLELCLEHEQRSFTRTLCPELDSEQKKTLTAVYDLSPVHRDEVTLDVQNIEMGKTDLGIAE